MRDTKHHLYLDKEYKSVIYSLNEFCNLLIQQGRYTGVVGKITMAVSLGIC